MTADLARAIRDYAELEIEIDQLVRERDHGACARCEKPCCRADVCRQVVESWWLREVSRHVHGAWWPDDWETRDECIAMTETGCMLKAGRPVICSSFVCDRYVEAYEGLWEAAFVSFVSDLLWNVAQLTGRVHIEQLAEDDAPRYLDRIVERVATGRRRLDEARRLLDDGTDDLTKHRVLLGLLCEMPRSFRATTRRALLARLDGVGAGKP